MHNKKTFYTFKNSLAFKYFRHWLPDDGLIDAIDASIDFELDFDELGQMVIKDVAVTFFPDRRMREEKFKDHPLRSEQRTAYRGCSHSGVASLFDVDDGWMKDGNVMPPPEFVDETGACLGYSPDGDFSWLKYYGFADIEYAKQAVEQFGFIRECVWARDGSIDITSLVKTYTEEEIQSYQIRQVEKEIKEHEYNNKKKAFDAIVNQKIASGEWVVPEGVIVGEKYLLFTLDALHWDENVPVSVFESQYQKLRKEIFGE